MGVVVFCGELVLSGAVLKALAKNPIAALGGACSGCVPTPTGCLCRVLAYPPARLVAGAVAGGFRDFLLGSC